MRKALCIISALVYLIGCDDKETSLEDLNIAPSLEYFTRSSTQWEEVVKAETIIDSSKVWTLENNSVYPAVLRAKDPNLNFGDITITSLDNDLTFFIDNVLYENMITVPLDSFAIAVRNPIQSTKRFSIKVLDTWGKENSVEYEINFLNNKGPIARLELLEKNEISPNEYEINAVNSFDRDKSIGGFIVVYEYTIDGVISTIPTNKIHHVFSIGSHIIKLRVQDNDGVWSEQINRNLIIN